MKKLVCLLLTLMLLCLSAMAESLVTEPGTYPVVTEPCELNIFYTSTTFPDNWEIDTNWFTQYYEELSGVHVNYEGVSGDPTECAQKVNLKLASQDLPDVFSKCNFTRAQEVMYGTEGVFIPLNDLIDNETVYIKKMFEDYPHLRDQVTAPDGNIYGIPEVILYVHGTVEDKMWVNQTWLDTLGMEKPTTTDGFRDMLIAFRDNDPNQNGIQDEIGLVTQGMDVTYLMNSFIYYDETFTRLYDGKIEYIATSEDFREGLRYLAGLVKDGLYAADSLTMDRTQRTALVMSGDQATVGALTALWPGHFATVESAINDGGASRFWNYRPLAPLEGQKGIRECYYNGGTINNTSACQFAITSACEHPEVAIRWLDYFYSLEGYLTTTYGPKVETEDQLYQGVAGWIPATEGEQGIDGEQAVYREYGLNNTVNCGWTSGGVVPRFLSFAGHSGKVTPEGHYEQMLYKATTEEYIPYAGNMTIPPLYMDEDASCEFNEMETNLKSCVTTAMAQFITGVRDIDADWDAFQEELKSFGVERYLEIYQEQYGLNYGD